MPTAATPDHFGVRLAERVAARESQLLVGLDPDPMALWPRAVEAAEGSAGSLGPTGRAQDGPQALAAAAVEAHCRMVLDAVAPAVLGVKPQAACFERLGAAGQAALEAVCEHARSLGLLVVADVKRGDIGITAAAYGQAYLGSTPTPFGDLPGLGADAMTASPYLGEDSLRPLLEQGRPHGRGMFVLVRTSNPGAADLQDLEGAEDEPVWARVARLVDRLGSETADVGGGVLADVGAVTGATRPEHLERLRELMPSTPFLLPGVGAQGGAVADLAPAVAPGRAGAIVAVSRSIVDAHRDSALAPSEAARAAAEALREQAWSLRA